jgi:hypothetical protein
LDSRAVAELPLASRNFTQLLGLSTGAATYLPDSTFVGRNTQTFSVNGARVTQNSFQLNGVDATTMGSAGSILVAVPAPETVQEFKVQTSLYDAAFGRAGGGNIQMVTRSGSNSPRGAIYEYFRNEALNANNPSGVPVVLERKLALRGNGLFYEGVATSTRLNFPLRTAFSPPWFRRDATGRRYKTPCFRYWGLIAKRSSGSRKVLKWLVSSEIAFASC